MASTRCAADRTGSRGPTVGIVKFEGDKLIHEHIYWDQASVLVQVGLLDPRGLPVAGAETAGKVIDKLLETVRPGAA